MSNVRNQKAVLPVGMVLGAYLAGMVLWQWATIGRLVSDPIAFQLDGFWSAGIAIGAYSILCKARAWGIFLCVLMFSTVTVASMKWITLGEYSHFPNLIRADLWGELSGQSLSSGTLFLMLICPLLFEMLVQRASARRRSASSRVDEFSWFQFTVRDVLLWCAASGGVCGITAAVGRATAKVGPYERMCVAWWFDRLCVAALGVIAFRLALAPKRRLLAVASLLIPIACFFGPIPPWAGNMMPFYPVPFLDQPVQFIDVVAIMCRNVIYCCWLVAFLFTLKRSGYKVGSS